MPTPSHGGEHVQVDGQVRPLQDLLQRIPQELQASRNSGPQGEEEGNSVMKPSDLKNVGAWRKSIVRLHNHRKPAMKKQAELENQLREEKEPTIVRNQAPD